MPLAPLVSSALKVASACAVVPPALVKAASSSDWLIVPSPLVSMLEKNCCSAADCGDVPDDVAPVASTEPDCADEPVCEAVLSAAPRLDSCSWICSRTLSTCWSSWALLELELVVPSLDAVVEADGPVLLVLLWVALLVDAVGSAAVALLAPERSCCRRAASRPATLLLPKLLISV